MGRGIGVGVVLDGEIHHGSQGTAGLLGHVSVDYSWPRV
ncbi:MAG: ROK family protein [Limnochordia bacterium]